MTTRAPSSTSMELRLLHRPEEMSAASELVAQIWKVQNTQSHVSPELLTAFAHAGNYVAGGFRGHELMAVCVGFFYPPRENALHSHIAGVRPDAAGTGWGRALKHHQRDWCLARGVTRVTWTYDPLVARNAYFNLHKLGCEVEVYLPDFYGPMGDGLNQGQHSDRIMVAWHIGQATAPSRAEKKHGPAVLRSVDRRPQLDLGRAVSLTRCVVEIPSDIEALRRHEPELAISWRLALRRALGGLLEEGWVVVDFDRRGHYCLTRST
ncbi:GNAT family N-acetyltransferase [Nonomuraea aurantiaca]|uniref:GNAT family N-acetyltransferase n=1 Tax=Nonomuraea aurantiaca TaxID=2878562 RepID=UPI001CD99E3B|nr:GNAT family N-acetyltransferase [Nonomuraea aurantiaca]MCA2229295.1 GNAT family N-acetyltransferase [Nonomuraea aurantiaca]